MMWSVISGGKRKEEGEGIEGGAEKGGSETRPYEGN